MNLPHLPPILFAIETLFCDGKTAKVLCEFPTLPTLAMFIEAAAQASSAFSNADAPTNGFLVLIKDASLQLKAESLNCIVVLDIRLSLGNSTEFYFEVFEKEGGVMYASGALMIVLEERGA